MSCVIVSPQVTDLAPASHLHRPCRPRATVSLCVHIGGNHDEMGNARHKLLRLQVVVGLNGEQIDEIRRRRAQNDGREG